MLFRSMLLDMEMPEMNGMEVLQVLRESPFHPWPPVIVISGGTALDDAVRCIELGAEDYLPKPFNPRELAARIKAVLRRVSAPPVPTAADAGAERLSFAGFDLEQSTRTLRREQESIPLTAGEYDLLVAFVEHPRRVLNRDQLLDMARGRAAIPFDRSIDVQVGRLRKKIELDPKNPALIKTVRGGGYMFTAEVVRG